MHEAEQDMVVKLYKKRVYEGRERGEKCEMLRVSKRV